MNYILSKIKPLFDSVSSDSIITVYYDYNQLITCKYNIIGSNTHTIIIKPISYGNTIKYKFNPEDFIKIIPQTVKKIIFDNPFNEESLNNLLNILPSNIKELEIEYMFTNGKEIIPQLNNLPVGLKKLSINNLHSILKDYKIKVKKMEHKEYIQYKQKNHAHFLHKINIKLPFNCKFKFYGEFLDIDNLIIEHKQKIIKYDKYLYDVNVINKIDSYWIN